MIYLTQYLAKIDNIGSRRQAEKLIRQNKVKVNAKLAQLGEKIEGTEKIEVKGRLVSNKKNAETIVIMLNKPMGYTCTKNIFPGEKNIYTLLPKKYHNFIIMGRLDKDSHGLLLLTNDGYLANQITHPKNKHEKKYLIKIANEDKLKLSQSKLYAKIRQGVKTKEGEVLKAKNIYKQEKAWLVILEEGKKRHLRRLFAGLGLAISDLKRIAIGELELKKLILGGFKVLTEKDLKILLNFKI
jgi:pseudouridine synthase